jgi:acyl-CoA thioester hydrolase
MSESLTGRYPIVLTQDLIWGDMDAYLHINNTVYFQFFETARMVYFDKIGVFEHKERTQVGPILASTRCDFRAPLAVPDTIRITAIIEDIKHNRFTMKHIVHSEKLDKVAAEGEGLIVFYDYKRGKSCEIPKVILKSITATQGDCI